MPPEQAEQFRRWIDELSDQLGEGLTALLMGMLMSHAMQALQGKAAADQWREGIRMILVPMLCREERERALGVVALLHTLSDDAMERPPGIPSHMPTWSDTADIMLSELRADPRTAHLFPAERLIEYESPGGRVIQIMTIPDTASTPGALVVNLDGREYRTDGPDAIRLITFASACARGSVPRWQENGADKCAVMHLANGK